MTSPVSFALVGFGNIGIRHAEHILHNKESKLVAICDIDPTVAERVPEGVAFYQDLSTMLEQETVEVLSVCTPNHLHEVHTLLGLEKGSHVVVEKPMAIHVDSCNRMIRKAKEKGKIIFAVKQNRYNEPVQEVKKLIDNQSLGKIFMIQVNCFWNRGDAYYANSNWKGKKTKDGGCLYTQFSHFVDILYYLNGDIIDASGWIHNYAHQHNTNIEDSGSFVLKARNQAIVSFNFTTCAYGRNMEGSITIIAEKGTVKIGGQYLNTIEYQQIQDVTLPSINITAKANDYGLYQGSMSNHDKVIANVVDVLRHGQPVMTSAEEAAQVVKIISMMYRKAAIL